MDCLTLGEPLICFDSDDLPLDATGTVRSYAVGAESNVAIGLARLGWDVAYVTADTTLRPRLEPGGPVGSKFFDLDRIDGGAFLALHHRLLEPSVEFRMIDYDERVLPENDYRATILLFKLTKRLSF